MRDTEDKDLPEALLETLERSAKTTPRVFRQRAYNINITCESINMCFVRRT